jgi:peptidyl-prolyl cis-trans isomerase D
MLRQMREWFRYLKWILLLIIVTFVWWAFATWGGGSAPGRVSGSWAARVNGRAIAIETFQSYARRLDSTYQSLLGEQYAQQRAFIRLGQQAIDGLVEQELLHQEALRQGITATPREVAQAITRDPNLQENGRFIGLERYRNLFAGGRAGVEDYESQVRRQLVIEKFRSLLEDGVTATEAEIEEEFLRRNARTSVEYALIDPARAGARTPPTDLELARFYEDNPARYSRGEGRTGFYVLFSPAELAPSQEVSDADVEAAYERGRATRFNQPEQIRASHILFRIEPGADEAAVARIERQAREVLGRARAGEDFAALARRHSQDSSAAGGGDLNFFGRGQMVPEFEEAAFALPVGGVSDLVRTPYGFHIIRVTDRRAARAIPLEEARESLREEVRLARAREEVLRRSSELSQAARGGGLEAAARSRGLTVRDTGPVREGEALPALAASQPVVARMLQLPAGEVSDPIPTPAGQVVVQVTGSVPPEPRPFAEVRDQVRRDLERDRALAAVREAARGARGASPLRDLARRFRAETKSQTDLARGAPLPGIPSHPEIQRQLASLAPGAVGEPIASDAGIVVLRVVARKEGREELEAQRDAIRDGLVRQRQDRLYRALLKRLRERGRVEINEAVVQSIDQA